MSVPAEPALAMTASEAARAIAARELGAEALTAACLARIEDRDALVNAWVHVDAELALAQARAADRALAAGEAAGPLHGVPVGIKDIFDTADMPTERGSALYRGRRTDGDAAVVAALRRAGAVILGKTVTAELALSAPGPTANPLDLKRTPGGSSSGSAAAVADYMVPLAVGSQTTGSVNRPASYCGIYAIKPSLGLVSTAGMSIHSHLLDHVGFFARDAADLALALRAVVEGFGEREAEVPVRVSLGVVRGPPWPQADEDARAAFAAYVADPGAGVTTTAVRLPAVFDDAIECQRIIVEASLAANLGAVLGRTPALLREETRRRVRNGLVIGAADYVRAVDRRAEQQTALDGVFGAHDALITLAAPGQAPIGLASTGNAVFSAMWTMLGTPTVTLPLLGGRDGLPIGLQLIGRPGDDAHLLGVARRLAAAAGR
ncbi:MAG: amidase [Gammaproteobacteria bacterium]|nr:amidase [Gammaproteobacteria bacterium]